MLLQRRTFACSFAFSCALPPLDLEVRCERTRSGVAALALDRWERYTLDPPLRELAPRGRSNLLAS